MADALGPELRDALAGITRRLDALASTLARVAPPSPPGVPAGTPLGEAERRAVGAVEALLAVSPALGRETALALAVDRVIQRAVADCAAVFAADADGRLAVVAERGLGPDTPDVPPGEGIVGRACREADAIVAGAADAASDALVRSHGLGQALALPVRRPGQPVVGVLFAGRRRPVAFAADVVEALVVVADRVALVLGAPRAAERPTDVPSALDADLDLARTAAAIARAAAGRLGGAHVALLLPHGSRFGLAGGVGLAAGAEAPAASTEPLASVMATGRAWLAPEATDVPALSALLGVPVRLVLPLRVRDDTVGLLVAGGPGPLAATALEDLAGPAALALRNARLYGETVAALGEQRTHVPRPPMPPPVEDLGSLLAVLLARIGLAREQARDPALASDLAVAEEAAWRAAEAVRTVLGFAPGQRGGMLAPLDPVALVREAVDAARARWVARGWPTPDVAVDLEPLPPVRGRADELAEALGHVLDNAAEASTAGGGVMVQGRWDGGTRVTLTVEDSGPGMDEPTRARAMEPFFTTRGGGRLGLGLAVAQATALRHQGTLHITSERGKGTRVCMALPPASAARPTAGPPIVRVLVIEDDEPVRAALVELLQRHGHVVLEAEDGPQGLALFEREAVDVVFTDLTVAAVSGFDVARTVKQRRPGTPVVLITGWPGRLDPAAVEANGIDRVVEKPVGAAEVLAALEAVLALRRGVPG
jgi:signal transduction histidine kinase/CheY-like chemotaxis protein